MMKQKPSTGQQQTLRMDSMPLRSVVYNGTSRSNSIQGLLGTCPLRSCHSFGLKKIAATRFNLSRPVRSPCFFFIRNAERLLEPESKQRSRSYPISLLHLLSSGESICNNIFLKFASSMVIMLRCPPSIAY